MQLDSADGPIQVTLPAKAWALLIAFGVAALTFFLVAGYVFTDQLRTVRDQDRKQTQLVRETLPILRAAAPVLAEARQQAAPTREVTRRTRRLLRTTVPLAEQLADDGRMVRALQTVLEVGGEVQDRSLLGRTSIVLRGAREALRDARESGLLTRLPRDTRALRAATGALVDETVRLRRRADQATPATLELARIGRETLTILRRLDTTQTEALQRLRNLDRRLGGSLEEARPGG
ncbi:hypothetical protein [Conexibacter sp. SYSU D00693]|uniref:hypothetical protein n=1 Tax=Conexibacter sp. SYSU D00693 TaxID=2812560 RepID=UPI00196AE1DF|nr:hypothetical protein [Conexibacter sp. SYSU D00693]